MEPETGQIGETKTKRAIAKLLKTEGAMTSSELASRLGLTAMAVRQHLYALQSEKLVSSEDRPVPMGRPAKYWGLTREADRLFPDAYAELSVSLLDAMGEEFGSAGVDRVLASRCHLQREQYRRRIPDNARLEDKVRLLAQIRSEEGYMAEVKPGEDGNLLLLENHCPICAAATACQGFCSTELDLFRSVLGPGVSVERVEHIIGGSRRCAYRIIQTLDS